MSASPGSQALERFQGTFRKEIEREYGVQTYGIGASFPVKINSIHFSFSTGREASINEGRRMVVSIANRFILRMNEDENLLKFLANNPPSITNVDLTLRFNDSLSSPLQSVMIIGSKKLVVYNEYNDARTMLLDLHEESFEEAEKIVKLESSSNSTTKE